MNEFLLEDMDGVVPAFVAEDGQELVVVEEEVCGVLEHVVLVAIAVGIKEAGEIEVLVIMVVDEMEGPAFAAGIDEEVAGLELIHGRLLSHSPIWGMRLASE